MREHLPKTSREIWTIARPKTDIGVIVDEQQRR